MKNQQFIKAIKLLLTSSLSNRAIGRQTNLHHSTIARYRLTIQSIGLTLEQVDDMNTDELYAKFCKKRSRGANKRQPDWGYIYQQLQIKGVTKWLLWHEYTIADPDTAYSYSQFNYYYREYLSTIDITMRQTHYAGEELFVDFCGKTISYFDSEKNCMAKAEVFVGVMGCSKYTFAMACKNQKLDSWIDCHTKMLEFLGGVPEVIVPDNLKSAVIKTGKIPELNRSYEDWADHYNCHIFPARPRKPQDKSLAEIGVLLVTRWVLARLRHQQFFSIEEINMAIKPMLDELNQRPFKRLPGSRKSRFDELDKPLLKPLPTYAFEYGTWQPRTKVGTDYHVYINNHAYSVPYKYIAKQVEARVSASSVEVYYLAKRIAIHKRSDRVGEHTTNPEHRPSQHQAYANQQLDDFLEWALDIGQACLAVVKHQYHGKADHSTVSAKACDQLKHLCKIHGQDAFETACSHAIELQSLTIKTIKAILNNKADQFNRSATECIPIPDHQNVRGAAYFVGGVA